MLKMEDSGWSTTSDAQSVGTPDVIDLQMHSIAIDRGFDLPLAISIMFTPQDMR